MRPCDCKSMMDGNDNLSEMGLSFNNCSIEIQPLTVVLRHGPGELTIPMRIFQRFAEWYLEDQDNREARWTND